MARQAFILVCIDEHLYNGGGDDEIKGPQFSGTEQMVILKKGVGYGFARP